MKHEITRIRYALRRRSLAVRRSERITPQMLRLTLAGEALEGFASLAPDDHVKIFVPGPDGTEERRDYTPRRHDPQTGELLIDFALHEAGPVTAWALAAQPGDPAQIGGPRGSVVVAQDFDWWLLIGDETALPAIGRRIEELPAGTSVTSIVAVAGPEEQQVFSTAAQHRAIWVHRPADRAGDPEPLLAALRAEPLPKGDGYVWIAAEGGVARSLRQHVLGPLGHPARWLKASGYWVKGRADATEKFDEQA